MSRLSRRGHKVVLVRIIISINFNALHRSTTNLHSGTQNPHKRLKLLPNYNNKRRLRFRNIPESSLWYRATSAGGSASGSAGGGATATISRSSESIGESLHVLLLQALAILFRNLELLQHHGIGGL